MEEIISFDKSFQHRFIEFNEALSGYDVLPSSQLQKQWGLFLEYTIDKVGWQAIWKLPRITCESLNIQFPSIALIIVLTVNTKDLKAYVRILAVQNEAQIPAKVWVPLTQLWPTQEQDKSLALSLMETANSLDMLRFFYLYVYMPWDRDEDDTQDWRERHLKSRLRFHFDLKNGKIPREVAEHIHNLLTECRRLNNKREFLEERMNKEEQEGSFVETYEDKRTRTLMAIHVRLMEIRTDIEVAENPLLRNVIIERFSQSQKTSKEHVSQIWLISDGATVQQHLSVLKLVEVLYTNEKIEFSNSLAYILANGNKNDVYLLNESVHKVVTTGALEEGGTIRGIGLKENVILTTNLEDVMFSLLGEIFFDNLTIDVSSAQCGILVRKGNCSLNNCKIVKKGPSSIYQAIIVLKGAFLQMTNCELTGFSTAVVGNSGSNIILKNCDIRKNDYGIKIFDESNVTLEDVKIRDCLDFGLFLETEKKETVIGDFECLKRAPEVTFRDVNGTNNGRGDVAIIQRPKLKPVENLFANPDMDPTIIESDDEEMN